jgi:DNA gyrase subunit B
MLGSDEIKTMIAALGCGIGGEDFDLSKLRYHRIIIMTDADVDGSHIRTLLLTFFYRQMPELINNGYVYIAQPPLFRAKRGKGETYIKDERDLETYLIHRAAESRTVKLNGREISGAALEQLLHRLMLYRKYLRLVERRGHVREAIEALLDVDAHDKSFFDSQEQLGSLAKRLTTATSVVTVQPDEENKSFSLAIEDRSNGYPRHNVISLDFVASPDYRTLLNSYREIRDIKPPMTVVTTSGTPEPEPQTEQATGSEPGGTEQAAVLGGRAKVEPPVTIKSLDDLLEYFVNAGKKGVAINRYKGLGEMNPDQLWTTTMNPEGRTLLQVRAEDHTEADQMFTTLMGDQVEPRRKFIEDNALDVRNLDI